MIRATTPIGVVEFSELACGTLWCSPAAAKQLSKLHPYRWIGSSDDQVHFFGDQISSVVASYPITAEEVEVSLPLRYPENAEDATFVSASELDTIISQMKSVVPKELLQQIAAALQD